MWSDIGVGVAVSSQTSESAIGGGNPDVAAGQLPRSGEPLMRAFLGLAAANFAFTALTMLSGPIAARALGPRGRGRLAAILVPFGWAPALANLGLPTYATRAAARGDSLRALGGTLASVSVVLGIAAGGCGVAASFVLAPRDAVVRTFIVVGMAMLPVTLVGMVGVGIMNGLAMWSELRWTRVLAPLTTLVGYVALAVGGALTVANAATVVYVGSAVAMCPLLALMRRMGSLRFDAGVLRRGVAFGARAWAGTLARIANNRLDQLIMIPLVSSRQLGFYAVAVNVTAAMSIPFAALQMTVAPRVARGDMDVLARAVRLTGLTTTLVAGFAALVVPWGIPLVFGAQFASATPMCWVLLIGAVPGAMAWVLGGGLQNAGEPGVAARGELIGLVITVPSLIVLVPRLGGMGAAAVSVVAYTINLVVQLILARRKVGLSTRSLLMVRGDDARIVARAAARGWAAARGYQAPSRRRRWPR